MKNPITKEQFLAATISQISQRYNGVSKRCRCGCKGNYVSTSYAKGKHSEVNDSLVAKSLKRAQRLIAEGAEYSAGDTYFDVLSGENRSLTFYFDDLIGTDSVR